MDADKSVKDENGKKIGGSEYYSIPIILNDKYYNLLVSCKYPEEIFTVIGARPMVEDSDPEAKNLLNSGSFAPSAVNGEIRDIKQGDVITPSYLLFDIPLDSNPPLEGLDPSKQTAEEQAEILAQRNILKSATGVPIKIGEEQMEIKNDFLARGVYAYAFELVNPIGGDSGTSEPLCFVFYPPMDMRTSDGKIIHHEEGIDYDEETVEDTIDMMIEMEQLSRIAEDESE